MSSSRATSACTNKALPPAEVISPDDLLSLGNPPAGDDHIRAFFGKRQGSGFADAGGASGDKDSLVLKGFH